ncbi:MAG TPA: BON domain-containing protein [Candidatus Manganitrophaceae bacterium]|nr:BON domain-containing protein [Candidatus Manganitrophaceae bacterium]
MKQFFILSSAILILAGTPLFAETNPAAPDNSKINKRDQGDTVKTPEHQSNDKADVELTRQIRKEITQDKSLSILAHNVKIITDGGKVTLRGPVNSQDEKEKIGQKAQQIAGSGKVQNELDVKSSSSR